MGWNEFREAALASNTRFLAEQQRRHADLHRPRNSGGMSAFVEYLTVEDMLDTVDAARIAGRPCVHEELEQVARGLMSAAHRWHGATVAAQALLESHRDPAGPRRVRFGALDAAVDPGEPTGRTASAIWERDEGISDAYSRAAQRKAFERAAPRTLPRDCFKPIPGHRDEFAFYAPERTTRYRGHRVTLRALADGWEAELPDIPHSITAATRDKAFAEAVALVDRRRAA